MTAIPRTTVEHRVQWDASRGEYDTTRELFLLHCDRELAGDIEAVLETLTPNGSMSFPKRASGARLSPRLAVWGIASR